MTHSGYWARQSHAHGVFDKSMSSTARRLPPAHAARADARAARGPGREVHEPLHRFRLEVPADTLGAGAAGARRGSAPSRGRPALRGATCALDGTIPAARVHALQPAAAGR